jgi:hypothetical protein
MRKPLRSSQELGAEVGVSICTIDQDNPTENPSLRHLAGKDAETWMKEKSTMSDAEFYKMMKELMK